MEVLGFDVGGEGALVTALVRAVLAEELGSLGHPQNETVKKKVIYNLLAYSYSTYYIGFHLGTKCCHGEYVIILIWPPRMSFTHASCVF